MNIKEQLIDRLKRTGSLPMESEFDGVIYTREQIQAHLGEKGMREVRRAAFDWETCKDYIASHGFGPALEGARKVAIGLWELGDDYATIGHEIMARGLTADQEDTEE